MRLFTCRTRLEASIITRFCGALVCAVAVLGGGLASAQGVGALGAAAIVESDETSLVMERSGRVRESVRREILVLSAAGRERHGVIALGHDAFRRVRKLEGEIRDAQGETVRSLRRDDVEDYPATASYSLYDDSRVRVGQLYHDAYPYTIVWEYEVEHEGLLNWPTWLPVRGEDPVLRASLTVDVPEGTALRYAGERFADEPAERTERGRAIFEWSVTDHVQPFEPLGPPWRDQVPALHLTTDRFELAGHAGSLASWAGLGQWYHALATGRDDLPPQAVADVERLVAGVESPRERARLVYDYLQRSTRYVSVQLGIGGWQPFPASYVYERRYGDCKALTNYLGALLAVAGVPSFPALIGHDRPDLDPDFPRNAFNHVILFVPLADGDLWLEATSQTIPFGSLGAGSEDRWTLVVEPGSGRLVRTPTSEAGKNTQVRRVAVRLGAGGTADVVAETHYRGHPLNSIRDALVQRSPEEQRAWWERGLDLPVSRLQVSLDRDEVVTATFEAPRYAVKAGSRFLFRPNMLERWAAVPPISEERTQPVDLGYPFADTDSVRIALPAGFEVEAVPDPVTIETPFARYESATTVEGRTLTYTRSVAVHAQRLPPEEYEAYRAFVAAVVRADEEQVVLKRR
jgi:transglutaminase-like putative cysteine protease